jgi:peptidoglycan/LPS O-acetylase OafA/YrhL
MGTVRFLLALWVVVAHASGSALVGITLFSGTTAVQCFYVISGFLITLILNERAEYRSLLNFYVSRYLRLWPIYIIVAVVSLLTVKWHWLVNVMPTAASPSAMAFIVFSNLTLFLQDWFLFLKFEGTQLAFTSNFAKASHPPPYYFLLVPQCWSLGVELVFYAIAPFCCRRWWSLVLLLVAGLSSRAYVGSLGMQFDPWSYRFVPSEMVLFAAGGLSYFTGRWWYARLPSAVRAAGLLCLVLFIILTFSPKLVGTTYNQAMMFYNPQVLLFTIVAAAPLFYATRESRIDSLVGELSYPMYVTHILIAELMIRWLPPGALEGNALYVTVVIIVSLALYFGVNRYTDRLRKKFGARNTLEEIVGSGRRSPSAAMAA